MLHPAIERRADPLPGGAQNGETAPIARAPGNEESGKRPRPAGIAPGIGGDHGGDIGGDIALDTAPHGAGLDRPEPRERPLDSKSLYLGAIGRRGGPGERSELPCCVTGRKPETAPGGAVFRCAALRSPGAAPCGLVVAHLRLVVALARRYEHLNLPVEDLIQEGNVGLLGAVRSYDPKQHGRFSRHAANCIRKAVCDALSDARLIHIPRAAVALRRSAAGVAGELEQRYGNEACDGGAVHEHRIEDDAAEMGLAPEELRENRREVPEVESLDARPDSDREPAAAHLADPRSPDPADAALEGEKRELLRQVVSTLPDTWRRVMEKRYGLDGGGGATFAEIGRALRLTPPRVHQIHAKGVKALRGDERLLRALG